jgi:small subunit ribosomal protein S6
MAEPRTYQYEAMFLLSQAQAADLAGAVEHINSLLSRAKAEIIAMRKWDERRLAYEIKKQKRGAYILTYFRAPASSITGLERDCNLSERVLRALILRCDHLSEDEMRAADARDALAAEARLRASEATRAAQQGAVVTAGAPRSEEAAPAPEPVAEQAEA